MKTKYAREIKVNDTLFESDGYPWKVKSVEYFGEKVNLVLFNSFSMTGTTKSVTVKSSTMVNC